MKKLSKKDEQLLLGIIILAIVVAIYYLMIIPFKESWEQAKLDKELASAEYEALIVAHNKPDLIQAKIDADINQIQQKEALIPESISKLDMVQNQFDIEKLFNGRVKSEIVEGEKVGAAYGNKLVVSYTLTYAELESLINKICSYEQKTGIDNINFTIDNNLLIGTMDVYFYSKVKSEE